MFPPVEIEKEMKWLQGVGCIEKFLYLPAVGQFKFYSNIVGTGTFIDKAAVAFKQELELAGGSMEVGKSILARKTLASLSKHPDAPINRLPEISYKLPDYKQAMNPKLNQHHAESKDLIDIWILDFKEEFGDSPNYNFHKLMGLVTDFMYRTEGDATLIKYLLYHQECNNNKGSWEFWYGKVKRGETDYIDSDGLSVQLQGYKKFLETPDPTDETASEDLKSIQDIFTKARS